MAFEPVIDSTRQVSAQGGTPGILIVVAVYTFSPYKETTVFFKLCTVRCIYISSIIDYVSY